MRKITVIIAAIAALSIAACGGTKSDSPNIDKADHNDPVAYQKAYCKDNGWKYEAATNTCKR